MNAEEYGEEMLAVARRQAGALELLAGAERERRRRELHAHSPLPFRLLAGGRGTRTLLGGLPGFAALWGRVVPSGYVWCVEGRSGGLHRVLVCVCGAMTALDESVVECSGRCGRFFLPLESSVRVKRFKGAA